MQPAQFKLLSVTKHIELFHRRYSGHVGVAKQRNGGHDGVPANPPGIELYFHANTYFCFSNPICLLVM